MQLNLLTKLFGTARAWSGPLTVVVDAEAAMTTLGTDSIIGGGAKTYAPRVVSGRIAADAACLLPDENALVLVQAQRIRQATGEDITRQQLIVVSPAHVATIEFPDTAALSMLGLADLPPHVLGVRR